MVDTLDEGTLDKIKLVGTTSLEDDSVTDAKIAPHTTSKITTTAKGQLNSAIVYNDQTNVFGDFDQDFKNDRLRIFNPADTFAFTINAPAITANWNLSLPLLTTSDIMVTEDFIQTLENKTLTAPTIVDLTNMTHDHSNVASGGSLTNSALNSGVFASITGLGVQTQALDMDGKNIILDADGDLKLNLATDDVFKIQNTTNQVRFSLDRKEVVDDGTFLAVIKFQGFNDVSSAVTYINIQGVMQSDVADAESSMIRLCPMENGTLKPYLDIDGDTATVIIRQPVNVSSVGLALDTTQRLDFSGLTGDTSIRESAADKVTIEAGGRDMMEIGTTKTIFKPAVTVNEGGQITLEGEGVNVDWDIDNFTSQLRFIVNSSGTRDVEFNNIGAGIIRVRIANSDQLVLGSGSDIVLNTTTGTKIGTGTDQKLAFYNSTPIAQQTGVAISAAVIHAALVTLGLITA